MVESRPSRVQVIVTAFNHGAEGEQRILDSTLSELIELDSIPWQQVALPLLGQLWLGAWGLGSLGGHPLSAVLLLKNPRRPCRGGALRVVSLLQEVLDTLGAQDIPSTCAATEALGLFGSSGVHQKCSACSI